MTIPLVTQELLEQLDACERGAMLLNLPECPALPIPLDLALSLVDYHMHTPQYATMRGVAVASMRWLTARMLLDSDGALTVSDLEALHYPRLGIHHDHGGGRTVLCSAETLTLITAAPLPASLQVVLEPDAHAMIMSPAHSIAMTVGGGGGMTPSVACVSPGSYVYTATPVLLRHYGSPVWLQYEGTAAAAPY